MKLTKKQRKVIYDKMAETIEDHLHYGTYIGFNTILIRLGGVMISDLPELYKYYTLDFPSFWWPKEDFPETLLRLCILDLAIQELS